MGVENIIEQGKRMGIKTWNEPEKYGLSITLGGAETTMLNLANVYGTVANSGKRVDMDPILSITDSFGNELYKKIPQGSQVLDAGVAFIISDILSDNRARSIEFGSNSPLNVPNHRVSVKTGTTDNKRDNWTVGFTPNLVVATWVGNNDNSPMSQALASGITGAAPMWNRIITSLLETRNEGPLLIPDSLTKKSCYGFEMYFLKGTEGGCRYTPITPSPTKPATALAQ
jgi:membrane peptidoglycan carboxypeptidase